MEQLSNDGWGLTPKRRALALGVLIASLAVVASSRQLHGWLISFLPVAEAVIRDRPVLGVSVFVVFAALSAMLAFVSSAVIVPVGVYVWGNAISIALLLLGWVLGGVLAYVLGRYLGRVVVKALISAALLEQYEARISRAASFGLVLLFYLAVPSEVPGYLLGMIRYDFRKFLAALTLAELPYSVATIYLGSSFVERRIVLLVGVGLVIAAFSVWALAMLHRRMREQRN